MTPDEYIQQRLDDQINWYSTKSQTNQIWFKRLRILEILCAATIPFLAGFISESTDYLRIVIGILGLTIAVIAGVLSIFKFQENWIEYRSTSEMLKHEKYMFMTKASPYNVQDSFPLLVNRVESLISKENTNWAQYVKSTTKEKQNG
jgi:hypothetical protein